MPLVTSVGPALENMLALRYNYTSLEDPIFSLFPAQGRPTLAKGEQLQRDGFEVIDQ